MTMNNMKRNGSARTGGGGAARQAGGRGFVDGYLAYLLARASHEVSRQFHAQIRRAGLAVPQWRVLATLWGGAGLSIGALARIVIVPQPTLTKIVDRMERAGLVARSTAPDDRRSTRVRLTAKGRARAAPLIALARSHERAVLKGTPAAEIASLKRLLAALSERCAAAPVRPPGR